MDSEKVLFRYTGLNLASLNRFCDWVQRDEDGELYIRRNRHLTNAEIKPGDWIYNTMPGERGNKSWTPYVVITKEEVERVLEFYVRTREGLE